MAQRQDSARQRVRSYLREHGPLVDESGGATAKLRQTIVDEGTRIAFIQLIGAMERAGEITRDIRATRTYKIALAEGESMGHLPGSDDSQMSRSEVDYERLAAALLSEVARAIAVGPPSDDGSDPASDSRRVAILEQQIRDLKKQAAVATEARDAVVAERDELARRLEASTRHLSILSSRLDRETQPSRRARVEELLSPSERELLRRLLAGHRSHPEDRSAAG